MKNIINNKITSVYVQSFHIKDELISKYNVIFLKIDRWYRVVISEGSLIFTNQEKVELLGAHSIQDDFRYPITDSSQDILLNEIIGETITDIKKLKYVDEYYYGVVIKFSNGKKLLIYEDINKEEMDIQVNSRIIYPKNITEEKF